jgi:hypothetical protein
VCLLPVRRAEEVCRLSLGAEGCQVVWRVVVVVKRPARGIDLGRWSWLLCSLVAEVFASWMQRAEEAVRGLEVLFERPAMRQIWRTQKESPITVLLALYFPLLVPSRLIDRVRVS